MSPVVPGPSLLAQGLAELRHGPEGSALSESNNDVVDSGSMACSVLQTIRMVEFCTLSLRLWSSVICHTICPYPYLKRLMMGSNHH